MKEWAPRRETILTLGGLIVLSTVVLTAALVGVLGVITTGASGVGGRLPFYAFGAAMVFVLAIIGFSRVGSPATVVISGGVGAGVVSLVIVAFAGEGLAFALSDPNQVFGSQLVVYFVSAGLITTGLVYWFVNHWREIVSADPE